MSVISSDKNLLAGSAAVTILLFFAGLFLKEQTDVAALMTSVKDHYDEEFNKFTLLQIQFDRNTLAIEKISEAQDLRIGKINEQIVTNVAVVNEVRIAIESLKQNALSEAASMVNGRSDRISSYEQLTRRIDEVQLRITEVQRQVSAIEGKLGESVPTPPLGVPH